MVNVNHDYVIDNQPGQPFRGDLNAALAAIVGQNMSDVEPVNMFPGMLWFDVSAPTLPTGRLRQRNIANNAWMDVALNVGERLIGPRTYYVRADGNDANTGMANTAAGAFRTITKAVRTAQGLNFNGYQVTIQLPSGTTTETVLISGALRQSGANGLGTLLFQGSTVSVADAANYKWTSAGRTLSVNYGARVQIAGIEISSTGDAAITVTDPGSQLDFGPYMRLATTTAYHLWAYGGGKIQVRQPYSIVGGGSAHVAAHVNSVIDISSQTVTLTGTPVFNTFAMSLTMSMVNLTALTFSGGATGARYSAVAGGGIWTNNGGANYLPGSTAGAVTAPGWYG